MTSPCATSSSLSRQESQEGRGFRDHADDFVERKHDRLKTRELTDFLNHRRRRGVDARSPARKVSRNSIPKAPCATCDQLPAGEIRGRFRVPVNSAKVRAGFPAALPVDATRVRPWRVGCNSTITRMAWMRGRQGLYPVTVHQQRFVSTSVLCSARQEEECGLRAHRQQAPVLSRERRPGSGSRSVL